MEKPLTNQQLGALGLIAPGFKPRVVQVRPKDYSEAIVKECYRNAFLYASENGCSYVLGVMFYYGLPIDHAWVHDRKSGHLDVTSTKIKRKVDVPMIYAELCRPRMEWVTRFALERGVAPTIYDVRNAMRRGESILEGEIPQFAEHVEEMAAIAKTGKTVTADGIPLSSMTLARVRDNVVILHHKEGIPLLVRPGWTMAYFMSSKEAADRVKDGRLDYLMFPFTRFGFGSEPSITRVWRKAPKEYLGALEATVKNEIYVDMLSVRAGYRKNHIASLLMDALREEWPALRVSTSHRTDKGEAFFNRYMPGTPQDPD